MSNITLDTIIEQAREIDIDKGDYRTRAGNLRLDSETGLLTQVGRVEPYDRYAPADTVLTPRAVGQMSNRLGVKHGKRFLMENDIPPWMMATVLNHFLEESPDTEFLIRDYGANTRSVLSDKYLRLDNLWVLETARQFLLQDRSGPEDGPLVPHEIARPYIMTPNRMSVTVIMAYTSGQNTGDGDYGHGVELFDGEVGDRSAGAAPVIKRTTCDNSIRRRDNAYRVIHSGKNTPASIAAKEVQLIDVLGQAFNESGPMVAQMINSRKKRLPNAFDILAEMTKKKYLPKNTFDVATQGADGGNTLFGLVNMVTYAAHKTEGMDPERRADLESFAGHAIALSDTDLEGDKLARGLFELAGSEKYLLQEEES